ncbi:MAG: hypothetical protein OEN01_04255 [Candidatus Krumholzibacteria bacterium]|nr:hypothetical protein [Candidatus Krumholzibacteria bacterium]
MHSTSSTLRLPLSALAMAICLGLAGCGDSDSTPIFQPIRSLIPDAPRDNREAEEAALWLSGELFASEESYQTIAGDLAAVRNEFMPTIPRLDVEFNAPWQVGELLLGLTESGVDAIRNGELAALDSLNVEYHLAVMDTSRLDDSTPFLVLEFMGRLHPQRLAEIYGDLDHIRYAEPNGRWGDWSNVYPWVVDGSRTYLFRYAWGDCPAGCISSRFWYFRVVSSGIEYVGTWEFPADPEPAWWSEARVAYHRFRGWPQPD